MFFWLVILGPTVQTHSATIVLLQRTSSSSSATHQTQPQMFRPFPHRQSTPCPPPPPPPPDQVPLSLSHLAISTLSQAQPWRPGSVCTLTRASSSSSPPPSLHSPQPGHCWTAKRDGNQRWDQAFASSSSPVGFHSLSSH